MRVGDATVGYPPGGHHMQIGTRYPVAVIMAEDGQARWTGGKDMPADHLPAIRPARVGWNKGRIVGQKRPILERRVWCIRVRLELAGKARDFGVDREDALSLSEGIEL